MQQRALARFKTYGKTTRGALFLAEIERAVPLAELTAVIAPSYPQGPDDTCCAWRVSDGELRELTMKWTQSSFTQLSGLAAPASIKPSHKCFVLIADSADLC